MNDNVHLVRVRAATGNILNVSSSDTNPRISSCAAVFVVGNDSDSHLF